MGTTLTTNKVRKIYVQFVTVSSKSAKNWSN